LARASDRVVAVGSDHAGYRLKGTLARDLEEMGYDVLDLGTDSEESCDYPDYALAVAEAVSGGEADRGILICGTGAGMAMVANKVPGIRAAACNEEYTAEFTRRHNDLNVLTVGARVIGVEEARGILRTFLDTPFEGDRKDGGRHRERLAKISDAERRYTAGLE
jgi:ribose 5-phosphate isomerase B